MHGLETVAAQRFPLWRCYVRKSPQIRSCTRATCTADHVPPPRAVGMPCALSPAARARSDVAPGRLQGLDRWPDVDRRPSARCCVTATAFACALAEPLTTSP